MRDIDRQRHRRREKQALCGEPDVGLDPRTLGSQPELKADGQPLSLPGIPFQASLYDICILCYFLRTSSFVPFFFFLRFLKFIPGGRGRGRRRSRLPTEQRA